MRNEQLLEQCLSMDSSDTENPDSSETNSEAKTVLFPQNINPFNSYYFPLPKETKEKCTQCTIKTRNNIIQTCPNVCLKCCQTVNTRKLTSTLGTQTTQHTADSVFEEQLLRMLQENNVLVTFAETLHNNHQTQKLVNCIQTIADGKFKVTNLCWKAFLDMGTLFSLKSTTQMEYDCEWLEFCQVIYHMFGAGVVNALRGCGHFSQVTGNKTSKSKYNPVHGEFNFPIPSIPTLKKLNIGFPSEIPVGFVEQSLDLVEEQGRSGSQFILSLMESLLLLSAKGNRQVTVICGVLRAPNLSTAVKILKKNLAAAKSIQINVENNKITSHYHNLQYVLHLSTLRIKRLRGRITGSFYLGND